jgi:hypothetical protein
VIIIESFLDIIHSGIRQGGQNMKERARKLAPGSGRDKRRQKTPSPEGKGSETGLAEPDFQTRAISPEEPKHQKRYKVTLTVRQRRYIRGRQAGLSKYTAAIQAGYSRLVALNAKEKIENSVAVRRALDEWLDQEGLSDGFLMGRE